MPPYCSFRAPRTAPTPGAARPAGTRGMIGALSLLVIALLTILATGLVAVGFREWRIGVNEKAYVQALFTADAGAEEAKMRLSPTAPANVRITPMANTTWRAYILSGRTPAEVQAGLDPTYGKDPTTAYTTSEPTTNYVFFPSVQGSGAVTWGWARIQHKINASGEIVYLDSLNGTETTASSQTVNGQPVNNFPVLVVTVRGVAGQAQREVRVELQPIVRTSTAQADSQSTVVTNPFGAGAHGATGVSLVGNAVTDSFNSTNGPYNVNGNRYGNGNISTDATGPAAIALTGNAQVNGSAAVGPNGDPSTGIAVEPNASITGARSAEASGWNTPLSSIPPGVTNQGGLSISGDKVMTLNEGIYWFSSVSITGNAQLQPRGIVKIYVTGPVDIAGNGVATAGSQPPNLLIYGTADPNNPANACTSVSIGGNANFYGAIYAPAAGITVDGNAGANVFGALTGKTVTLHSGALHYDEALQNLGVISSTIVTNTNTSSYTPAGYKHYLWSEAML